jgi:hypothetical protein
VSAGWLRPGCDGAVCISVDDVHPGRSNGHYEAGGDLSAGVLGRLERLLDAHPQLRITLFVTPDWRELSPAPTRNRLSRLPGSRYLPLTSRLPRNSMRIDRHEAFSRHLAGSRFELAVHGLHHFAPGPQPPHEFASLGVFRARRRLRRALGLFARAGLAVERGLCPPGWTLTPALERALVAERFRWVSSARDIETAISPGALTAMSGLRGVSLIEPQRIADGQLVHVPVNFQATSPDRRAFDVIEHGGLLSVKAHAVKNARGHVAADGLDDAYAARLDRLLTLLEDRYGDRIWWASMGEIAARA